MHLEAQIFYILEQIGFVLTKPLGMKYNSKDYFSICAAKL